MDGSDQHRENSLHYDAPLVPHRLEACSAFPVKMKIGNSLI